MPEDLQLPARNLKDAFNACDPTQPLAAGDERYVDLAPGRGEEGGAVHQCLQRIERSNQPLVQLFAGHRGCGKSTELKRLQGDLEKAGYFVAYIDADADLDFEDTEPVDILLALLRNLDLVLREEGIQVKVDLLEDFLAWFDEVTGESTRTREAGATARGEAEIKGKIPLFAKLMARLTGWVKTGSTSKETIRRQLDPLISQLLQRMKNFTLAAAQAAKKQKEAKDLVVIVDSLDRIALKRLPEGGPDSGRTTHEMLFIERGELLKGLGCHTVYTVPISLMFSTQLPNLNNIFPDRHIVPMVKVQDPTNGKHWDPGRDLLRKLLAQRLDLETIFKDGAVDALIDGSGGHPRQLMNLARYAFDFTDNLPVTQDSVEKAKRRLTNDYGRSVPEEHWRLLARVHESQAVQNDTAHQEMLFNLSVLEYQNEERWCDVNPAILTLPPFEKALKQLRQPPASSGF